MSEYALAKVNDTIYRIEAPFLWSVVHVDGNGRVFWCADWDRIDEFVDAGILERVHRGPGTYGHCDYYVNPEGGTP